MLLARPSPRPLGSFCPVYCHFHKYERLNCQDLCILKFVLWIGRCKCVFDGRVPTAKVVLCESIVKIYTYAHLKLTYTIPISNL